MFSDTGLGVFLLSPERRKVALYSVGHMRPEHRPRFIYNELKL